MLPFDSIINLCCYESTDFGRIFSKSSVTEADNEKNTVMATARKNTPSHKIGVRLARNGRNIVIEKIENTSIFYGTDLEEGMHVLSVNGVDTSGKTVRELSTIIAESSKHPIEIRAVRPINIEENIPLVPAVAELPPGAFLVEVTKSSASQKLGLRLSGRKSESADNGREVVVGSVAPSSPFRGQLAVGMQILSINGVQASSATVKELSSVVSKAKHHVAVVAMPIESSPSASPLKKPKYVPFHPKRPATKTMTYKVHKKEVETKVGLHIRSDPSDGSKIVVTAVAPDGLFAKMKVKIGSRITKFQGYSTSHLTAIDLSTLMRETTGEVKLEMEIDV